jgi:AcrR family transcriptional regulator
LNAATDSPTVAEAPPGLRERKKLRTRQALIDAALRLYRERGLEGVTIAEITRIAEVAPRTFFAYFESKEDVFLGRGDERIDLLIQAIRNRRCGEPVLAAARHALRQDREPRRASTSSGAPDLAELLRHPAVAARLRVRWNRWEDMLAEAIATDVGAGPGDPEPRVVAAALTGAIRVAAATAEAQPRRRTEFAERAFDLLASGLDRYGATTSNAGSRR